MTITRSFAAATVAECAKQTALIYGVGTDDLDTVKRFPLIEKMTGYDADYHPIKPPPGSPARSYWSIPISSRPC